MHFYSQPFNEMFVFSCTFRCYNGTFAVYIAANKDYLTKRQIIFRYVDSAFHLLYCLIQIFIQID